MNTSGAKEVSFGVAWGIYFHCHIDFRKSNGKSTIILRGFAVKNSKVYNKTSVTFGKIWYYKKQPNFSF